MEQTAVEIYNEFMNKDYLGVRVTTEDRIIHAMEAYKLQSNKAKWQQERSYSEEEVLDIIHKCGKYCYDSKKIGTDIGLMPNLLIGFFEQFKKK